jgi:putative membrane protein
MKTLNLAAVLLTTALLPAAGIAQDNAKPSPAIGAATSSPVRTSDRKFIRAAAQGGLAEVELGKLAAEKASSEDVKKFGQRMVDDHGKGADQLKELANQEGITVPQQLSPKDKMLRDRLAKLSGDQFDRAYMANMVKDHTQDVSDFERESKSGKDSAVRDFAAKTLPTLQDHLRQAREMTPPAVLTNGQ